MGQDSKIEWTHHTFNPWHGCLKVSEGCEHCYAETFSKRVGRNIWGPAKTTERLLMSDKYWQEPLKWNQKAKAAGERHRVFCASMADVFEDHPQMVGERRRLLELIINAPHLDWLLLTKRPENINWLIEQATDVSAWLWFHAVGDQVWVGTSIEDQANAEKRISLLLDVPAKIRFLSCEPLLGPIDLTPFLQTGAIDWVILGGESGPRARPMQMAWMESMIDQCRAAGVAIHVKQLGSVMTKQMRLKDSKGGDWDEWPAHLRIREYPR